MKKIIIFTTLCLLTASQVVFCGRGKRPDNRSIEKTPGLRIETFSKRKDINESLLKFNLQSDFSEISTGTLDIKGGEISKFSRHFMFRTNRESSSEMFGNIIGGIIYRINYSVSDSNKLVDLSEFGLSRKKRFILDKGRVFSRRVCDVFQLDNGATRIIFEDESIVGSTPPCLCLAPKKKKKTISAEDTKRSRRERFHLE